MGAYIGIDPGLTGGIAILDDNNNLTLHEIPRLGKEVDIRGIYEIIHEATRGEHIAAIENVHAIPGTSAGSNFAFGNITGIKEGILIGCGASYVKIAPKTWQKDMWEGVKEQIKPNGKKDTKAMSMVAAMRWFPKQKFLKSKDGLVDAALIAQYLKMRYGK